MASNFDVTQGTSLQDRQGEPLIGGAAPAAGGGATGKLIGIGVAILAVLALVGGVVAWLVTRPHGGATTTTGPHTVTTRTTTMFDPAVVGGYSCVDADPVTGDCLQCARGFMLSQQDPDTPPPDIREDRARCFYKCEADLNFPVVKGENKGLCLDDTTFEWCSGNIPFHWPNTDEPVKSIRMFKAWQGGWTDPNNPWNDRHKAWENLARYFNQSGAKVLVGTQVTCDPEADDEDWENVMTMIKMFGADAIMGVAIGNEMELYYQKNLTDRDGKDIWNDCMKKMWMPQVRDPVKNPNGDPYFRQVFKKRLYDLDSMDGGFHRVPVTSVFGGAVFAGDPNQAPFVEMPWRRSSCHSHNCPIAATVYDFLRDIVPRAGDRWRWVLNIYPYFNPGWGMDPDGIHCSAALQQGTCFNRGQAQDCDFSNLVALMRQRMSSFEDRIHAGGGFFGQLWVGETGWSAPMSDTLSSGVVPCADFSSVETFERYYKAFLSWDMQIPQVYHDVPAEFHGPDHVFWFTIRDSANFDKEEHFGLIGDGAGDTWCSNVTCKLNDRGIFSTTAPYTGPSTTTTTTTPRSTTTTSTTMAATTTHPFRGTPKCCYNPWWSGNADDDECRFYPGSGAGKCNNNWSHDCGGPEDTAICLDITTLAPTTTVATTTVPATSKASTRAATTSAATSRASSTPRATTSLAAATPRASITPASEREFVL